MRSQKANKLQEKTFLIKIIHPKKHVHNLSAMDNTLWCRSAESITMQVVVIFLQELLLKQLKTCSKGMFFEVWKEILITFKESSKTGRKVIILRNRKTIFGQSFVVKSTKNNKTLCE